jgi:very-short-patch-repair endonuclease
MSKTINPPLPSRSRDLAIGLRLTQTHAELCLWQQLRGSRLLGFKFRRQHPLPPYVLDFYCDSARIAVELDGSQHSEGVDDVRTRFIESRGIEVLRFWDNDVLSRTEQVLESILMAIQARTLTPTPLPAGEGLKTSGSSSQPILTSTDLAAGEGLKTSEVR